VGKLIPSRLALALVGAWLALALAAAFFESLLLTWQIAGIVLAAALVADGFAGLHITDPASVERRVPVNLALGRWTPVTLRLSRVQRALRGLLHDAYPPAFDAAGVPQAFAIEPGQTAALSYRIRPLARGHHRFGPVAARVDTPLRLWQRGLALGAADDVRVYPDFARITQYTLLATDHRLAQIGLLQRRRRGEGLDFHQLREYRHGDTSRQVDWKATARMGRLIAREYQDERDQRIVFLVDCGQRMRAHEDAPDNGERALSHFDHALNALLLLAYVALRQGDAVGVQTFGHPAPRWLAPRKSVATVNFLLNGLFDLEPSHAAPDYLVAAERLYAQLTRRSLVVIVTNLRDEDDSQVTGAMRLLRRRHLTLVANLREPGLDQAANTRPRTFDDALAYGAAQEYLMARAATIARLRREGARVIDAHPQELPRMLVNQYWQMKRAGEI
jgi:uncharacterized protein (DUF58 family)